MTGEESATDDPGWLPIVSSIGTEFTGPQFTGP